MMMNSMETTGTESEICFLCRRPLGEVALRYINGELFCDEYAANLRAYGLIGAACKRQMELALHAMSHKERDIDGMPDRTARYRERSPTRVVASTYVSRS